MNASKAYVEQPGETMLTALPMLPNLDSFAGDGVSDPLPIDIYAGLDNFMGGDNQTTSPFTSTVSSSLGQSPNHVFGDVLFAYTSPFLILLGLVGNVLSLIVFMSGPRSSKVARSQYLLCLGISDSVVLLSYVLPEWVKRGVTTLDPSAKYLSNMVYDSWRCYTILFFSYSSRFISAWLRVLFTFERFYSIRFPFRRLTFANRVTRIFISMTVIFGLLLCSLKPPLMQSRLNLELSTSSTTGSAPSYSAYSDNYDIDIKTLLTSSPNYDLSTKNVMSPSTLSMYYSPIHKSSTTDLMLLSNVTASSLFADTATLPPGLGEPYEDGKGTTTTQVNGRMLQALLHAFGTQQGKAIEMNSSEFIDTMLGEPTPNPVCVVRPEFRKYGELYDTLYFGVFIMLLPFLLIIIFDFNVLYVVRHREGQLQPQAAAAPLRKATLASHQDFAVLGALNARPRILSVVGTSIVPDKLTVMLVLSSCFILLNLPYFIVWSIYSYFIQPGQTTQAKARFTEMPTDIFNNLSFAARTISGLTYSVNGLIYLVSDHAFRADFVGIVKKCWFWRRNRLSKSSSVSRQTGGNLNNLNNNNNNTPRIGRVPSFGTSGHRGSLLPGLSEGHDEIVLKPLAQIHQQSPSPTLSRTRRQNSVDNCKTSNKSTLAKNGSLRTGKNEMEPVSSLSTGSLVLWASSSKGHVSASSNGLQVMQPLTRQRSVHFADELLETNGTAENSKPPQPIAVVPPYNNGNRSPPPAVEQEEPIKLEAIAIAIPMPYGGDSVKPQHHDDGDRSSGVSSASSQSSVTLAANHNVKNRNSDTNNSSLLLVNNKRQQSPINNKLGSSTNTINKIHLVKSGSGLPQNGALAQSQIKGTSSMLVIYCELESCI